MCFSGMLNDSRKRWLTFFIVTIPALFLCCLLLLVKFFIFPRILAELLRLRPHADGSLTAITHDWANYPADILFKFYIWNVTNADEVIYEGAIPRLQDHGPYTYVCHERKENITWSDDGREVSYRNRRWWHFNSDLSCDSCAENDRFIVPNFVYAGMSHIVSQKGVHPLTSTILDLGAIIAGSGPMQTLEAGELLFYSYNDPIVALKESPIMKATVKLMGGTLLGTKLPEQPKVAGILPFYNNSFEPEFRINTGQDNLEDITKIVSFGGQRSTDWNIGEEIQDCNEGAFNKQFRSPEDKLNIFISYLGRSFEMEFHEKSSYEAIPTYVYRINKDEYDTNSEKQKAMRYENKEEIDYFPSWPQCPDHNYNSNSSLCTNIDCSRVENLCNNCCQGSHLEDTVLTPPGFYPMRVFPGRIDRVPVPVFVSPPHMLWAPEEVSSIYTGQYPDEEQHRPIEWTVNPTLGVAVHAEIRMQMNLAMWSGGMTQSSSLPNAVTPMLWLHIDVLMHDNIKTLLKLGGLLVPFLYNAGIILLLIAAFISISVISLDKITRLLTEEQPATQLRIKLRVVTPREQENGVLPI